ncbi:hypothetical protein Plhal304r1_c001g0002191 [Plasmopara halstedii]
MQPKRMHSEQNMDYIGLLKRLYGMKYPPIMWNQTSDLAEVKTQEVRGRSVHLHQEDRPRHALCGTL